MNNKFVLILKSSPRANSNSSLLAGRVGDGARAAGALVESFNLAKMSIQPCDSCDGCRGSTSYGQCILNDDMQTLYPRLRAAGAILLASPVYWFTFSAQLKLCIDRWYALETSQGSALKGKHFGLVLVYGDTDPYTSGAVNAIHTFEDMARYLHGEIDGVVYGSATNPGEILAQKNIMDRAYQLEQKLAG